MDVKSVFKLSISFFSALIILSSFASPAFAQVKKDKKGVLGFFSKKNRRTLKKLRHGELLAYKENIESDIALEADISPRVINNYVLENDLYCKDSYFTSFLEEVLHTVDDSILYNLNEAKSFITSEDDSVCVDDEFVFLNDSQTVIPVDYLLANEYFSIWDSKNLDPYGYELKDFKDTVNLKLYELENWSPPVKSTEVNSKYGLRRWRWHHGIDLDLERGDSIYAAFDGIVRIAKYNWGGYGYYIMLRHKNGLETLYGHLTKYLVEVGQEVKAGELIGLGGSTGRSTGPHLHFETRYQGHAFDPTHLYDFDKDTLLYNEFTLTAKQYEGLIERSKSLFHRIRSGDTLSHLAVRYGTSISRICRLNGISRRTVLRIGRTLRVR